MEVRHLFVARMDLAANKPVSLNLQIRGSSSNDVKGSPYYSQAYRRFFCLIRFFWVSGGQHLKKASEQGLQPCDTPVQFWTNVNHFLRKLQGSI